MSTGGAICSNQSLLLQSNVTGTGPVTYTWTGSGSFSSNSVANPTVTGASGSYTLTVSNACGTASSVVTATVNPAPSVSVSATATTVCNGQQITLTASGATSYSWTGGISNGVAFTPTSTASYTVTGTTGSCSNTAVSNIVVTTCTGLNEPGKENRISVYPNPSQGIFHINSSEIISGLTICNVLGAISYQEPTATSALNVDLSNLSKGIYVYHLTFADGSSATGKIIIE